MLLTAALPANGFQQSTMHFARHQYITRRAVSISSLYNDDTSSGTNDNSITGINPMVSLVKKVRTVKVAYINNELVDEDEYKEKKAKKKRVVLEIGDGAQTLTFEYGVEIPIVGTLNREKNLGLSLREVKDGDLSELCLELDTLRYVSLEEEVMRHQKLDCSTGDEGSDGSIQILDEKTLDGVSGIVISSVGRGGIAWDLGIRAGDLLVATSATIGNKMWPKSTFEGVRSAISSRRVMSKTMQVKFQRANEMSRISGSELVQEFEVSLTRPMGIHIEDTEEGYVRITGFTDDAPENVSKTLKVGDRIIAVDSSLGNKMWEVSKVEGVVSAVTTRLPGQPVQIKFERVVEEGTDLSDVSSLAIVKGVEKEFAPKSLTTGLLSSYSRFSEQVDSGETGDLLSRCRSVLNRYMSVHDKNTERSAGVLALVAERVLESLADASASLDAKTLSLVMSAYIACDQPQRALAAFEAAVGLNADGSPGSPQTKIAGRKSNDKIVPSLSGLNLFTVTDVIRAHAAVGDSFAARRVLAAIEGAYETIDGVQSHYWGDHLKADTKCHNTVLAAVVNANDIVAAEEIFEQMSQPSRRPSDRPKRNPVSYNIMIGAYARSGRREDAFDLFKTMNEAGLKPDKVTITALIKAVIADGDFDTARSLLRDMKKAGIGADVVAYNTVIRALCERLRWFEAKELVADMEADGVNPDGKTYGLLMNGLLKLNKPGPCLTLFESACADQRTAGLMENVKLYTTAITAAASLGDSDRAFELVSRMNFAGVKPNMKSLTALMGACVSNNEHRNAIDVFKKIKAPDGYAKTICIRAYCGLSEYETALEMIEDDDLSGKQTMASYNYMIGCALNENDFEIALSTMDNLLRRGFVPSKGTLAIIINTLGLFQKKIIATTKITTKDNSTFKFLLKILDAFDKRKLEMSGQFYAAILAEGARMGGLEKRIASLIVQSKADANIGGVHFEKPAADPQQVHQTSWLELLQDYSELKNSLDEISLPQVRVQVNERDIRQVLFSERSVSYTRRISKVKK